MLKTTLKSLTLPYTTGFLIRPTNRNNADTSFEAISSGIPLSHVFIRALTGMLNGERVGVDYNILIPYRDLLSSTDTNSQTPIKRDMLILADMDSRDHNATISTITWTSGDSVTIVLALSGLSRHFQVGDYASFSGCTYPQNDGIYVVTAIDWSTNSITIKNPQRTDATKNETGSSAKLNRIYALFQILNVQEKIQSLIEDHYLLQVIRPTA